MDTQELRQAIEGKSKWEVQQILQEDGAEHNVKMDNGYFGAYSLIDYKGKQAVVYIDDRDAKVRVVTDFHDKVYHGNEWHNTWDGDYRWNHDKPLLVYDEGKGYNLAAAHTGTLLCDKWIDRVPCKSWRWDEPMRSYVIECIRGGWIGVVTTKGTFISARETSPEVLNKTMDEVKTYTTQQIIDLWINKGKPCAHIHGLEYKGARAGIVSKEKALALLKTHHDFGHPFNSAEWRIIDGKVTLLFRDYADSDYD